MILKKNPFAKRTHKFNAKKVTRFGKTFASEFEASVYGLLLYRERAGEISNIECQVRVEFRTFDHGKIRMVPDFKFTVNKSGEIRFAEAKGMETPEWKRKSKAWAAGGPALLEVWKGTSAKPFLERIIIPATT